MALIRRRPPPAPSTTPTTPRNHPPSLGSCPESQAGGLYSGVKMMRRIELKDSPGEPHWYMDTMSDFDALNLLAGRFRPRRPMALFHVVKWEK